MLHLLTIPSVQYILIILIVLGILLLASLPSVLFNRTRSRREQRLHDHEQDFGSF